MFPDLHLHRLSFEYPGSAGAGPWQSYILEKWVFVQYWKYVLIIFPSVFVTEFFCQCNSLNSNLENILLIIFWNPVSVIWYIFYTFQTLSLCWLFIFCDSSQLENSSNLLFYKNPIQFAHLFIYLNHNIFRLFKKLDLGT